MRKTMLLWSVGLIAIGSLTGCEALKNMRDGCCGGASCKPAQTSKAQGSACPARPTQGTLHHEPAYVQFGVGWWGRILAREIHTDRIAFVKITEPADAWPIKPGPQPTGGANAKAEITPTPRHIGLVVEEKIDQPDEIVIPAAKNAAKRIDPPQPTELPVLAVAKEKAAPIKRADIQVGKAENFTSITGQVQQWRKTWRIRYAPVDQEDVYGGSVTLEGAELNQLRDGQHVRVQGVLIPPADRLSPARYQVKTIEIVD